MIKILPHFIANRIAAGEVIGRPSAVVKELIENSIDADADKIQLIITDAGKSLILVTDNGKGMGEEDAMLSFHRHATSKISEPEDLERINTFGFRGEALASICAVAQVELKTRTAADELGTMIKNHGSEVIEHSKIKCDVGTSVAVKNLFYNTPARRNFLKTNQTEFRHIYDAFIRLAVAHNQTEFTFINDSEILLELKPALLRERLSDLFGKNSDENRIEVKTESEIIALSGFISKPSFSKKTRQDQFLFLNGRFIINKQLSYAVHLAYGDLIAKGDYPDYFLFLKLDPEKFDINVHPSKLEVKFDDDKAIFSFIRRSVEKSLSENNLVIKSGFHKSSFTTSGIQNDISGNKKHDFIPSQNFRFLKEKSQGAKIHEMYSSAQDKIPDSFKDNFHSEQIESVQQIQQIHGKNTIWQFNKKYILYQLEDVLMVIDQHAAHERILYEQTLTRLNTNANLSQQLLIPLTIELNPVDYDVLSTIETELRALGFDFESAARRKIRLKGVPSDVRIGNENQILQELIDEYKQNNVKLNLEKRDNLAKSYACKHAIKSGDFLNENEMLNLIDNLFLAKMPYVCPHGRPTIIKISVEEFDKKFARTGF